LNKKITNDSRITWQLINVVAPIGLLLIFGIGYQVYRKRKYTK